MRTGDRSDHFVPLLAYSTGLRIGRLLGEILSAFMRTPSPKGNRMSTTEIEAPPPPVRYSETEEEYAERIRAAIRRGIKASEEGRVQTHEEALRRLAPWLGA
ncbi:hypothetical protein [Longimicrobium sp.]|uniref:hypothetical protein n=1 Tax=Longimicrobium sp. TaxID=2029185 RepID=UPI003B3B32BD